MRQPVVALRTEDEIDSGRPADDLFALGLGNAAGNGDRQLTSAAGLEILQSPQAKLE